MIDSDVNQGFIVKYELPKRIGNLNLFCYRKQKYKYIKNNKKYEIQLMIPKYAIIKFPESLSLLPVIFICLFSVFI